MIATHGKDATPRYVSSWERATTFQLDAADVSSGHLRAAADVLAAVAGVSLRPLERAMTTDSSGNPIRTTPEQQTAWSTYVEAMDERDRLDGWVRALRAAAERQEGVR